MIVLLILSLIPLILGLLKLVNNQYLFIGLFALDFLIVGIVSTMAINPLLSFKDIIRKYKQVIPSGLLFALLSTAAISLLNMTASNILIFLSIIGITILIIAYLRKKASEHKIENPEEYNEKHIIRNIVLLAILCVVSYVGMEVPPFSVIPLWFGLCIPFIVLIPGYLCLNIVNPYKDEIRIMERLGVSIFASLVITSIIGLLLTQIENFLNMRHVSMVLVVITLIILLPLYYIRIKEKKSFVLFNNGTMNRIFAIITVLAIIAVITSGVLVSTGNVNNKHEETLFLEGNTTFEVSGIHETPDEEGYYTFYTGDNLNLSIKIKNEEHRDMTYKLAIDIVNDTETNRFSEQNITVKNNKTENIETNITMTPGKKDIKFTLYDDANHPYKIRHLYINVNEY